MDANEYMYRMERLCSQAKAIRYSGYPDYVTEPAMAEICKEWDELRKQAPFNAQYYNESKIVFQEW